MRCRGPRCRVTGRCLRRRRQMCSSATRSCDVRFRLGLGVMQGLRSIQRRRANGTDAKNQKSQLYGPNAVKLHPVNILPTFGSRAARSPSGVALRALNACHARLFRLGPGFVLLAAPLLCGKSIARPQDLPSACLPSLPNSTPETVVSRDLQSQPIQLSGRSLQYKPIQPVFKLPPRPGCVLTRC